MRHWKRWFTLIGVVFVMFATTFVWTAWHSLSSEWRTEAGAAQFALNHSPLQQLTGHSVFTGAGVQEVFIGKDSFGRIWYAFVYGSPYIVKSVPATGVWSAARMNQLLSSQHIKPVHLSLGYLDAANRKSFHITTDVIWECYVHLPSGAPAYVYYDAHSGQKLATYILSASPFGQLTQNFN